MLAFGWETELTSLAKDKASLAALIDLHRFSVVPVFKAVLPSGSCVIVHLTSIKAQYRKAQLYYSTLTHGQVISSRNVEAVSPHPNQQNLCPIICTLSETVNGTTA